MDCPAVLQCDETDDSKWFCDLTKELDLVSDLLAIVISFFGFDGASHLPITTYAKEPHDILPLVWQIVFLLLDGANHHWEEADFKS